MGRLDDHAKKRIVELRKAGLSFRKIKNVLELDNIRVTPQAIYLFLKRKNVEPAQLSPSSHQQPAIEKESQSLVTDQAGWEGDKLWDLLQENRAGQSQQREPRGHRIPCPTLGAGVSHKDPSSDSNQDGIKIVSVTSLSKDGGQFVKPNATHGSPSIGSQLCPSIGDNCPAPQALASVSCPAPVTPTVPQHTLNSKGKIFLPPARNLALIAKRKILDRAIHLQKKANVQNGQTESCSSPVPSSFMHKVQPANNISRRTFPAMTAPLGCSMHAKDASTQTCLSNPTYSPTHPASPWGGQMAASPVPTTSPQSLTEKLDAVHAEIQKLAQAMHLMLERQCRLERQQEQQQRTQQEVLMALQQLSSTVSQEAVPGNQTCPPYNSLGDPSPSLPNFSHFKMELI